MTELRITARCVLVLACVATSTATLAQVMAPSAAASAAAERAQKETDRTKYWIRVLAEKPAPKPAAAPKPTVTAAPAPPAKIASSPEPRVKVAATASAPVVTSADVASATSSSVVAATPAATAPSLATGTASIGNSSAMTPGSVDAGASGASLAESLAAAPRIDVPATEEEADPGLIMIKSTDPEFPISTMHRLRRGEIEVRFEVGPDGVVSAATVTKPGTPSLDAAAVKAVRQWRFKPTPKGHTALVNFVFNLDT